MNQVLGGCCCGGIEFQFDTDTALAYECHCSICQKASGSAFSTTVMVRANGFRWLKGQNLISTYKREGGYKSCFCSQCGSPVPNAFRGLPLYSVPVGSLDNPESIQVAVRLHLDSKARWDRISQSHNFESMPALDEILKLLKVESQD